MRGFLLLLIIVGSVPCILVRPQFGVLMWFLVSLMNVHQYTWGFAAEVRPALIVGLSTIVAWLASRDSKVPPASRVVVVLGILTFWMTIAAIFAIHPDVAIPKWEEYIKILLMTFVTICIVQSRERINQLVWIVVISIGFYGVKGGIFTLLTHGDYRVWGPPDTFIADNNALACALIMILPLMNHLRSNSQNRWIRYGLWASMALTVIAILGSYSRGALLGLMVMSAFLAFKTRHRVATAIITVGVIGVALVFLPQQWYERMQSIETYQHDESALGRFDAWKFAYRLALDHPITGGGYSIGTDANLFHHYVPTAPVNRAAHSIYFQVLGEMGFVGLGIYLMLLLASYRAASNVLRIAQRSPDLAWARSLAAMVQVSVVGFSAAGAFLSLGFYDLYYAVVAIIAVTELVVRRVVTESSVSTGVELDVGAAGLTHAIVSPQPAGVTSYSGSSPTLRLE